MRLSVPAAHNRLVAAKITRSIDSPAMTTKPKIRILVADDHEALRCGVKALLEGTEIEVAAEAATGQSAVKAALEKDFDLVLLDLRMPDGDGLTALSRIKLDKPDLPILLFSAFDNLASVARAIALGANGFLLKGCSRDELLNAIRIVAAGENIWSKKRCRSASYSLRMATLDGAIEASLSERETEVLRHMAMGLSNKQIAETLKIDSATVSVHVHQILRKLGLVDRTQAAVWAVRNNLV